MVSSLPSEPERREGLSQDHGWLLARGGREEGEHDFRQ